MLRRLALLLTAVAVLAGVGTTAPKPVLHYSDADALSVGASTSVVGTLFAFSSLLQGHPVRWDPCTAIHWKYRSSGQVAGGLPVAKKAVARISALTGTHWVYDGTVTTAPTTAWLPKTTSSRPPVLIGWTNAAHSDLLRGQSSSVLGVTRTAWFGLTHDGTTTAAIRGAVIALNQAQHLPLSGSVSWYDVMLHELAHAMGLAHASSSHQLMYPVLQRGLTDLQSGDKAGLARVGRSAGCIHLA